MKLPNGDRAVVPPAKITRYLLDLNSEQGKSKATFFLAFGFTIERWEVMVTALRQHAIVCDVTTTRQTERGIHYVVEGALQTPDGRNPQVRTVWKIERGELVPGFVTAYPA
jgi:hypothetical protein